MTARSLREPVRVMSRLATWADYGLAVALALCRRLRLPAKSEALLFQPAFEPVYAVEGCGCARPVALGASLAPGWREPAPRQQRQPWYVRPAEVVMLSLSFFLAAHLFGGGTPEARAPQVSFALVQAAVRPVPSKVIEVRPSAAADATAAAEAASVETAVEALAAAPSPDSANAEASAVQEPAEPSAPAPEPAEPAPAAGPAPSADRAAPAPPAAETPAAAPSPTVAPPAASLPALTYAQVIAYAIEAGWPAELTDAVARVAWCESRFRPDAVGYGTYGLMQVVPLWFEYAGLSFETWADPVANLKAALAAFRYGEARGHKPWAAWSCKPEAVTIP